MVLKPAIRNEHHEAYRAGRLDEIPLEILPLLEENYKDMPQYQPAKKTAAKTKEVKPEGDAD